MWSVKIGRLNPRWTPCVPLSLGGALDSEDRHRVRRVFERAEELMEHDWTEGSKFSERLRKRLDPLRGLTDRS
ncbi:hypothetical protein AKJ65_03690 [candidate division MSBL1 archaeon SCGC-AAA259E19]|uniref:Uncharacterized protein n=1 Tax=candidate division MSBL1 archaeon SCGC-AAA259E19 TaxID=1698264 RepID=A0A133UKP1_9EURY|nr:hypothetical protein AKJ65_03690 [candidate division MSBL1 archaeon SCGC-AAA259E19]